MHRRSVETTTGLMLILSAVYGGQSIAAADTLKNCEQEFTHLQTSTTDVTKLTQGWIELGNSCQGTGFYEYRLSKLYINAREYAKATQTIESGLVYGTAFNRELLLAKGDIYLHQKDYATAENAYRVVTTKHPGWYAGFNYLGFALFAQGKHKQAIEILDKANSLMETADTYRTLTLAHHLLDNHEKAVESLNRAFSLDEDILADRDPMVAGIRSYAEIGKFDVSRNLLALLLNRKPEIKSDEEYLKAGFFVRQKMIDAGLIVE